MSYFPDWRFNEMMHKQNKHEHTRKFTCATCGEEKSIDSRNFCPVEIDGKRTLFCSAGCASDYSKPAPQKPPKPLTRTDIFLAIVQAWFVIVIIKAVAWLAWMVVTDWRGW